MLDIPLTLKRKLSKSEINKQKFSMNKKALVNSLKSLIRTVGGLAIIMSLLLSCIVLLSINSCTASRKIENYQRYYKASETLLDSLESHTTGLDRHNLDEVYNKYYAARKLVKP